MDAANQEAWKRLEELRDAGLIELGEREEGNEILSRIASCNRRRKNNSWPSRRLRVRTTSSYQPLQRHMKNFPAQCAMF